MMMSSVYLTKSLGTMGRSYKFERDWGKRPQVKIKKTKKTREQSRPSDKDQTEDDYLEYDHLEMEALDEELKERIKNRR